MIECNITSTAFDKKEIVMSGSAVSKLDGIQFGTSCGHDMDD